ncbi:unnamed protein product [Larinioides sclopetarius]|uniref:Uncharacterized protein n=1 Tax=Larinioides sclopetarius TaxID=280406 RepID=A0AAV2BIB3_9ARAC
MQATMEMIDFTHGVEVFYSRKDSESKSRNSNSIAIRWLYGGKIRNKQARDVVSITKSFSVSFCGAFNFCETEVRSSHFSELIRKTSRSTGSLTPRPPLTTSHWGDINCSLPSPEPVYVGYATSSPKGFVNGGNILCLDIEPEFESSKEYDGSPLSRLTGLSYETPSQTTGFAYSSYVHLGGRGCRSQDLSIRHEAGVCRISSELPGCQFRLYLHGRTAGRQDNQPACRKGRFRLQDSAHVGEVRGM